MGEAGMSFHTCMDELAEYHAKIQAESQFAIKRDAMRAQFRHASAWLKEEDEWFLRALISVLVEELGGIDGIRK
jgi:hypothetical protein